jgi:hypothetical protein
MGNFYDNHRYSGNQVIPMRQLAAQTSVIASDTIVARHTWMHAVTVKDWNLVIKSGDVLTGTADSESWIVSLGKSAAGTGAVAVMGSSKMSAVLQGGTYAANTVVDCTLTETDFAAGDDIVLQYEAGTALPAGTLQVDADVMYVEKFNISD